ncbi:MAG: protease, partial [Pontibacter sp.]|nr:protease [Pontibacter sp.]
MFTKRLLLCAAVIATLGFASCQQEEEISNKEEVSQEVLSQIKALGFSNQNVQKVDGGYVVEGDIFLSNGDLSAAHNTKAL